MGLRESCRHPSKFRRDSFGERNEGTVAALADLSIRLKDPRDTYMGMIGHGDDRGNHGSPITVGS